MMKEKEAQAINTIANYLGARESKPLTKDCLNSFLGKPQADVMTLFGSSIICGGDVRVQEGMRR
jgi:hypothetical protein